MEKRWISLLAENEVGVLAGITGLFSGKSYNLNSLTAGPSEDPSIYRVTIGLTGDDRTFEQIKKQLNRSVEVIKVMDFTGIPVHLKELMFLRISGCSQQDMTELFRLSQVLGTLVIDYGPSAALLQSVQTERKNDDLVSLFQSLFPGRIEIVRGGSVGTETISLRGE